MLCNIHLNTVKAEEDCCICLCPKDKPYLRIKLVCGHYHHIACLAQMNEITCPICRTEMNGAECSKVFTATKAKPLMDRVFDMSGAKQKVVFGLIEDMIKYVEGLTDEVHIPGDTNEIDVFKSYMANYFTGITILKETGVSDSAPDMIYDWVDVMHGAFFHIKRYGTYAGFHLVSNGGTMISWDSAPPLPPNAPQEPYAAVITTSGPEPTPMNLPPPVNINASMVNYAPVWQPPPPPPPPYSPTVLSPSPVMRWWAQ
jgi:hypothetical protein